MAITTYTELQAAMDSWLEHDDLSSKQSDFIALCESGLNRDLRISAMQKADTGTLSAATLAAPTDIVEPISFQLSVAKPVVLKYLPPEQFFNGKHDTGGQPVWYTLVGHTFHFTPQPDSTTTYDYTLNYYARWDALSYSNAMNWLLTNAPDVYLYGSLLHAAPFMLDDARIGVWQGLYGAAVSALQGQDQRLRYRGGRQQAHVTEVRVI